MQLTTKIEKTLAVMQEEGEQYCIEWGNDSESDRIWDTDKTLTDMEDEYTDECNRCIEAEIEEPTWDEWASANYEELDIQEYDEDKCRWLVYTDTEADEAWQKDLENFVDECVLPEIPEAYRNYFDDEKFIQDCKYDGRGHSLARYDGHEQTQEVNGTTYYLYRQQ